MRLKSAHVKNFKSIEDSGTVAIDDAVTVLVGQNESGKTAFLKALDKAHPIEKGARFDVVADYPRKGLNAHEPHHANSPAEVVVLTYQLTQEEIATVNTDLAVNRLNELECLTHHYYDTTRKIIVNTPEKSFVEALIDGAKLSAEIAAVARNTTTM